MFGIILFGIGAFIAGNACGKDSAARIFLRALHDASKQGQTVREFLHDLEADESEAS